MKLSGRDKHESGEDLETKISKGIKETGYPLQMEVGAILDSNGWTARYCHYYVDIEEFKFRELDIVAWKTIKGILVGLFIQCKHSKSKQWVFFAPQLSEAPPFLQPIKHLPRTEAGLPEVSGQLARRLPIFTKGRPFALYMDTFGGSARMEGDKEFRSALLGSMKALIYELFRRRDTEYRHLFLPIIVFDNHMFMVSAKEGLNPIRRDYIAYHHYQPFELGASSPVTIAREFAAEMQRTYQSQGADFIAEVIRPDGLERYLHDLSGAIDDLDESTLDLWGKRSTSPIEIISQILRVAKKQ